MKKVLQKFNINDDTKSISTQLAPYFKLKAIISPTSIEEREYMTHVPYTSMVGCLMYEMVCVQGPIYHKLSQWIANTYTIPTGVIERQ